VLCLGVARGEADGGQCQAEARRVGEQVPGVRKPRPTSGLCARRRPGCPLEIRSGTGRGPARSGTEGGSGTRPVGRSARRLALVLGGGRLGAGLCAMAAAMSALA
jgi:hypothetical protein